MSGFLLVGVILLPIVGYIFITIQRNKIAQASKKPEGLTSKVSGAELEKRTIEVACRAVMADGVMDDREIQLVCGVTAGFVPSIITPDQIREMVAQLHQDLDKTDFLSIGEGLDDVQRQQLLQIAMHIIGKKNLDTEGNKTFLNNLCMGLLIVPEQKNAMAASLPDIPSAPQALN